MSEQKSNPLIDREYLDTLSKRMISVRVDLDPDPLNQGPTVLNEKIAETANQLTKVRNIQAKLEHNLLLVKRQERVVGKMLELKINDLIVNDPMIKPLKSQKDRDAAARLALQDAVDNHSRYLDAIFEVESVMEVAKLKTSELRDVSRSLKDQMRMCQEEIKLGGRWGKTPTKAVKKAVVAEDNVEDFLTSMLTPDSVSSDDTVDPPDTSKTVSGKVSEYLGNLGSVKMPASPSLDLEGPDSNVASSPGDAQDAVDILLS